MLTQEEYENLRLQRKQFKETFELKLGPHPIRWSRDIHSLDTHDTYILDFNRSSIKIKKYSFNKRYKTSIILIRYCSDKPHTNPPGTDEKHFSGAHLHIYRAGFDDKIAVEPNSIGILSSDNIQGVLQRILVYFNINNTPHIQNDLF